MTITHAAAVFWECGRIDGFTNGAAGNYLGWVMGGATERRRRRFGIKFVVTAWAISGND
ncbi:MAG: hypothetical protein SPJ19_04735 [Candidatus Borkfalkiaceae bacterium]|nr:hypothetical protein [Christensenellaceae bacterium]